MQSFNQIIGPSVQWTIPVSAGHLSIYSGDSRLYGYTDALGFTWNKLSMWQEKRTEGCKNDKQHLNIFSHMWLPQPLCICDSAIQCKLGASLQGYHTGMHTHTAKCSRCRQVALSCPDHWAFHLAPRNEGEQTCFIAKKSPQPGVTRKLTPFSLENTEALRKAWNMCLFGRLGYPNGQLAYMIVLLLLVIPVTSCRPSPCCLPIWNALLLPT